MIKLLQLQNGAAFLLPRVVNIAFLWHKLLSCSVKFS